MSIFVCGRCQSYHHHSILNFDHLPACLTAWLPVCVPLPLSGTGGASNKIHLVLQHMNYRQGLSLYGGSNDDDDEAKTIGGEAVEAAGAIVGVAGKVAGAVAGAVGWFGFRRQSNKVVASDVNEHQNDNGKV